MLAGDAIFCSQCGAATPTSQVEVDQAPSRVGTLFASRYELTALVGEGGMAQVYAAYDRKHDRRVAVKMLRPDVGLALGSERFLREIGIAAKLSHPHILPLYDSGEEGGALFYVMPLVEGESLRGRIAREGIIGLPEAAALTREVGEALTYAHEQGFVHRDIKPDNIMLSRGHALVADFGIARAMSSVGASALTGTGTSLGTPLYMSPEQCLGDPAIDFRTDIYSLGCVCFEMLAGRPPFLSNTLPAILARHITEAPPLDTLPADCPDEVVEAIGVALAKAPMDRFPSAQAFGQAMQAAVVSAGGTARIPGSAPEGGRRGRRRRTVAEHVRVGIAAMGRGARWCWGTPRWAKLLSLLVAVLVVISRNEGWSLLSWWRTRRAPVARAAIGPRANWELSPGIWTASLVNIGDSAVGVRVGPMLSYFDGVSWRQALTPYFPTTLDAEGGRLFAYPQNGGGPVYELTDQGWVPGSVIPIGVRTIWHNGTEAVAAGQGEMAERKLGVWRQLPTGRRTAILKLFGPRRDSLTGIGVFASGDTPDSLLIPAGAFWRTIDPRPAPGASWVYQDGALLSDGTAVVVGYVDSGGGPLVMYGRSGASKWTRAPVPEDPATPPRFDHVIPLEGRTLLLLADGWPGLWTFDGAELKEEPLVVGQRIRGATTLAGRAVVLTDAGTLLIRRRDEFEILGELPLAPLAGSASPGPEELRGLATAIGLGGRFPVIRMRTAAARIWALTEQGILVSVHCEGRRCTGRRELGDERRRIRDIATLGDTVLVVGEGGLVRRWNGGGWQSFPGWSEALHRGVLAANGRMAIATDDHVYLVAPGGRAATAVHYAGRGTPIAIAANADSGVALIWPREILVIGWDGKGRQGNEEPVEAIDLGSATLTNVAWGCGGRLLLTAASLGDPLAGGELYVARVSPEGSRLTRLFLPRLPTPIDLESVEEGNLGRLSVRGRGGLGLINYLAADSALVCGGSHP